MTTPLETWLSEVENRINNRFDGSGDFTIKAPTDLKKAVRIIERMVKANFANDFLGLNKIAAMSDKEFWE